MPRWQCGHLPAWRLRGEGTAEGYGILRCKFSTQNMLNMWSLLSFWSVCSTVVLSHGSVCSVCMFAACFQFDSPPSLNHQIIFKVAGFFKLLTKFSVVWLWTALCMLCCACVWLTLCLPLASFWRPNMLSPCLANGISCCKFSHKFLTSLL